MQSIAPRHLPAILRHFGERGPDELREISDKIYELVFWYWATRNTPLLPANSRKQLEVLLAAARKFDIEWRKAVRLHPLIHTAQIYVRFSAGAPPAREMKELPDMGAEMAQIIPNIWELVKTPEWTRRSDKRGLEHKWLWEPLMRLMVEYDVGFHEHGHLIVAVRELHAFAGIGPPTEGSVRPAWRAFKKQVAARRSAARTRR